MIGISLGIVARMSKNVQKKSFGRKCARAERARMQPIRNFDNLDSDKKEQ